MRQSELDEYVCGGEECPTCGRVFETRRGVGQHHTAAHGESLLDHEATGIECPSCGQVCKSRSGLGLHHSAVHGESIREYESTGIECPKGCGQYRGLALHWSLAHDEPFPDGVPKISAATRDRLVDANQGKTLSEDHKRNLSKAVSGEANPNYGKPRSKETRQRIAEGNKGKTLSKETRAKISVAMSGENHPRYGATTTNSKKTRRKMSEANMGLQAGEDHPMYGKSHTEEARRRISEARKGVPLSEEHKRKISKTLSGRSLSESHKKNLLASRNRGVCNVPTQHTIRNGWEREIDLMLYDSGFDFEYEPEFFEIGNGRSYLPDFRVGGDIIEVKGYKWHDPETRAEMFMESHPEYRYIVVGTKLPADVWISWEDRKELCGVLDT